jgi:hypothetical protein
MTVGRWGGGAAWIGDGVERWGGMAAPAKRRGRGSKWPFTCTNRETSESLRAVLASWYEESDASADVSARREAGHHRPFRAAQARSVILQRSKRAIHAPKHAARPSTGAKCSACRLAHAHPGAHFGQGGCGVRGGGGIPTQQDGCSEPNWDGEAGARARRQTGVQRNARTSTARASRAQYDHRRVAPAPALGCSTLSRFGRCGAGCPRRARADD